MSDDLLKRATEALREETSTPDPYPGRTRARLLESARLEQSRGSRSVLRWFVPVASVFVVGTALARYAPEYLPALLEVMRPAKSATSDDKRANEPTRPRAAPPQPTAAGDAGVRDAGSERRNPPLRAERTRVADVQPATPDARRAANAQSGRLDAGPSRAAPDAGQASQPAGDGRALATRPKARGHAKVRPVTAHSVEPATPSEAPAQPEPQPTAAASSPAVPDRASADELAQFRHAQALHLAHDPAALAAWDAYLQVAKQGALIPEAKYNRALCLVRLGRKAEARAALQPFASGQYTNYRREEARALLEALKR
jgi:hypothetical protein